MSTVAFITGGNRGIGLETARQLGKEGVIPVIGSRNPEAGRQAVAELRSEGIPAEFLVFEATSAADRETAYTYFETHHGRLDILVNNAGLSLEGQPAESIGRENATSSVSEEILRQTLEANFFSVVLLTHKLLPLLKKSPAGRIVNVSSVLGSLTLHSDPAAAIYPIKMFAYDTSKTALNAFTVHLAHELKDTTVKVNSAHPGWVQTRLGGSVAPLTEADGAQTSVRLATIGADGPTGALFHGDEALPW